MQSIHYIEVKSFPGSAIIEAKSSEERKNRVINTRIIVFHALYLKNIALFQRRLTAKLTGLP